MKKHEYKVSLIEKAAEKLDIPGQAAMNLPILTVMGCRKVHLENHKGIIGYSDTEITVNCGKMMMKIEGASLQLAEMTDTEILAFGALSAIRFEY